MKDRAPLQTAQPVAGGSRVVWIVDSQHWPRAYLRAELLERGFEAVGFATLGHAMAALEHPLRGRPGVAVVELRGLGSKAREELGDLAKRGIPVVLLGGSVEVNREWVVEMEWAAVIKRPVTVGAVADEVEQVVRLGGDDKDCQWTHDQCPQGTPKTADFPLERSNERQENRPTSCYTTSVRR